MSEHSVIAWDLETVPDLKAVARMIDMEGEADEKVRAALGSGFPKHPLHKIVCIGALVASRQSLQRGVPGFGYLGRDILLDLMLGHRKLYGLTRTRQRSRCLEVGNRLSRSLIALAVFAIAGKIGVAIDLVLAFLGKKVANHKPGSARVMCIASMIKRASMPCLVMD